jgi:hypothetical protein
MKGGTRAVVPFRNDGIAEEFEDGKSTLTLSLTLTLTLTLTNLVCVKSDDY